MTDTKPLSAEERLRKVQPGESLEGAEFFQNSPEGGEWFKPVGMTDAKQLSAADWLAELRKAMRRSPASYTHDAYRLLATIDARDATIRGLTAVLADLLEEVWPLELEQDEPMTEDSTVTGPIAGVTILRARAALAAADGGSDA